jgi:hypothetical protein
MLMSGHRTRAVFERYNVVDTQDMRAAVRARESGTRLGYTPCLCPQKHRSPTGVSLGRASAFRELRGPAFRATANHVPSAGAQLPEAGLCPGAGTQEGGLMLCRCHAHLG